MDSIEEMIDRVIREVAELPDRSSPLDWPEAMLVTYSELAIILYKAITARDAAIRAEEQGAMLRAGKLIDWMANYIGKMAPLNYHQCYADLLPGDAT